METTTAIFELDAEKKHSVVYKEEGNTIASSIYFSKNLVGSGPSWPLKIKVTVEDVS